MFFVPPAWNLIMPLPESCMCSEVQQPAWCLAFLTRSPAFQPHLQWLIQPEHFPEEGKSCEDTLIIIAHKLAQRGTTEALESEIGSFTAVETTSI